MVSDPNAPGAIQGGYRYSLKVLEHTSENGVLDKTDSNGVLSTPIIPDNFISAEEAAAANWKSVFGIDIDGDSIITSTYDS